METAAATPAPWPVTVQAIMFLMAAWLVLSPATARPATNRFLTLGGTKQPKGTSKYLPELGNMRML